MAITLLKVSDGKVLVTDNDKLYTFMLSAGLNVMTETADLRTIHLVSNGSSLPRPNGAIFSFSWDNVDSAIDGTGTQRAPFINRNDAILKLGSFFFDQSAGGGGASTFLKLTDTPDTYLDQFQHIPSVNETEDALEWFDQFNLEGTTTGLLTGGIIADLGVSTISVSAGTGRFVNDTLDYYKTFVKVEWPDTILTIPTGTERVIVLVDPAGTVFTSTSALNPTTVHLNIILGEVLFTEGDDVFAVFNTPFTAQSTLQLLQDDLLYRQSTYVISGAAVSGNINDTFKISNSAYHVPYVDVRVSAIAPHEHTVPASDPVSFYYYLRNGAYSNIPQTDVRADYYDANISGTVSIVPAGKFTNQFLNVTASDNVYYLIFGQELYDTLDAAIANGPTELSTMMLHTHTKSYSNFFIGYWSFAHDASDLTNTAKAKYTVIQGSISNSAAGSDHRLLDYRDAAGQHPIGAIDGLQTALDAKVDLAGDTMTGFLTLHATPTAVKHAAPKDYVDAGDKPGINGTLTSVTGWRVIAKLNSGDGSYRGRLSGVVSKNFTDGSCTLSWECYTTNDPGVPSTARSSYILKLTGYDNTSGSSLSQAVRLYRDGAGKPCIAVNSSGANTNLYITLEKSQFGTPTIESVDPAGMTMLREVTSIT